MNENGDINIKEDFSYFKNNLYKMEFPLLTEKIWLRLDNLKIAFLYVNTIFKFYFSFLTVC